MGGYKADFRKERLKWEGRFTHYPGLNHKSLSELLRTCTAFVLSSCEEGFARVNREAMAAGLPVIATHESGADTVIEHGRDGLIVPVGDVPALADAMLQMIDDPSLCKKMGEAAALAGADSWQNYGDRLIDEYRRRIESRMSNTAV